MADYSKWKVTELKAELKTRGVPQTGLRLKQDFIDKLIALDSQSAEVPVDEAIATDTAAKKAEQSKVDHDGDTKVDDPVASPQPVTESLQAEEAPIAQQEATATTIAPQLEVRERENAARESSQLDGAGEQRSQPEETSPAEELTARKPDDGEIPAQAQELNTVEESTVASTPRIEEPSDRSLPPASEVVDDLRKRKRRSRSPAPSEEVIKKSKIDNESPKVILKEEMLHGDNERNKLSTTGAETIQQDGEPPLPEPARKASAGRQDPRYRDLLHPTEQRESAQSLNQFSKDDDRQVEPALHPATSSIYIRNFMRPLQPAGLKSHLKMLATPADKQTDAEPLVDFFLDSIKTHCFALFDSVSTASRVRSKLHSAIWPNERDRKPLWVDFIPEDKLGDWIKTEQRSPSTQRWEVVYEESEDGIKAILKEARGSSRSAPHPPPTAPARRPSATAHLEPRRESQLSNLSRKQSGGQGFKALDDRFKSTTTKPKLYYLPVSRDVVDRRLAQFASLAHTGSQVRGQGGDDLRRITFEDTDVFVDGGPHFLQDRDARHGAGRGGGRGSWRGRRR